MAIKLCLQMLKNKFFFWLKVFQQPKLSFLFNKLEYEKSVVLRERVLTTVKNVTEYRLFAYQLHSLMSNFT